MANRVLRDWTCSEKINELSIEAEQFFTRLIMKADDFGRFYGSAKLLKAQLYPLKDINLKSIEKHRDECVKFGIILLYHNDGKEYVEIQDFNQRLRIMKSKFPEPSATCGQMADNCLTDDGLKRNEEETETKGKEDSLTTDVVDKKKQTFEEQVEAFLGWWNQMMLKRKGKLGRFNKLSKPDRNNFKEVRDAYEFKDFEIAFNNMYKNQWAHDTGNLTPTHFLKLSNFNRYLNQSSSYTPASKILDHD
jgi:hypothetical protein